MLNQKTKKVDKRLPKSLIIISILLFLSITSFAQIKETDSIAFKKDFDSLLSKYGIKNTGYQINVISLNQHGGQTAFVINNNYNRDSAIDSTNLVYTITSNTNGQKILKVGPKTGIWMTPFVGTDSAKSGRKFIQYLHNNYSIMTGFPNVEFNHKVYSIKGYALNGARSSFTPISIILDGTNPNDFYIFGDITNLRKIFFYDHGLIGWLEIITASE